MSRILAICAIVAVAHAVIVADFPSEKQDAVRCLDDMPIYAIMIGSGISAMAAAMTFAGQNKKVLILEKLYKPGGCTHTFPRQGVNFNSGFHLFSDMKQVQVIKALYGEDVQFGWPAGYPRDHVVMPGAIFDIPNGYEEYTSYFYEMFPGEHAGLDTLFRHMDLMNYTSRATLGRASWSYLSSHARRIVLNDEANIGTVVAETAQYASFSAYIDALFSDPYLKALFVGGAAQFIATPPGYMPPSAGIDVLSQFRAGFSYPVEGAEAIQTTLAARISRRGGRVQAGAEVAAVLFDRHSGKTKGVRLTNGTEYLADTVVATVGLNLIRPLMNGMAIPTQPTPPNPMQHSMGFFITFIKMSKSARSLGLNPFSIFMPDPNLPDMDWMSYQAILVGAAPLLVFENSLLTTAFTATGNPATEPPAVIELMSAVWWWEWAQWANTTTHHHPADYYAIKTQLQDAQLARFYAICPGCVNQTAFVDSATPLTIRDYVGKQDGGALGYIGLTSKPPIATGVPGLYFAGCDIMTSISCAAETGTQAAAVALGDRNMASEFAGIK